MPCLVPEESLALPSNLYQAVGPDVVVGVGVGVGVGLIVAATFRSQFSADHPSINELSQLIFHHQ